MHAPRRTDSPSLHRIGRLYHRASYRVAGDIIRYYSSSFSLASAMLAKPIRADIQALYAVVRIADEIVDGAAEDYGLDKNEIASVLSDYEQRIYQGIQSGFSSDPIIHAFVQTCRRCDLRREHLEAFFDSMRADIHPDQFNPDDLDRYIFGSAEVIGLMCACIFFRDHELSIADRERADRGARHLGAAFQKINFLRDLSVDRTLLGRRYVGSDSGLTSGFKDDFVAEIRSDLDIARQALPLLPLSSRLGVRAAWDLFSGLTDELDRASIEDVSSNRIRLSSMRKASLVVRSLADAARKKS